MLRSHHGRSLLVVGHFIIEPVDVGGDSGEDGWLLLVVAAEAGAEADNAVHFPGSVAGLNVQGTTGITVACRDNAVTASADHGVLDLPAPPVRLGAGSMIHHWEESLLKVISDGSTSVQTTPSSYKAV